MACRGYEGRRFNECNKGGRKIMTNESSNATVREGESRELRALNRNFSLGEYGESWTKLERYLFIEIYNVIKDFYISASDENIKTFSSESILLTLPIKKLDSRLFGTTNKSRYLMSASEGLSKKQINFKKLDSESGQWGFSFISMFPEIRYDAKIDKSKMTVRIPNMIYEEMVPIKSYCLLDLKLLSEFGSGNTVRLYEIFKSYAFRKTITITFNDLRKQLGFFKDATYPEWKHFNAKVLKPAVQDINSYKEHDIEVFYEKKRGLPEIEFRIKTHKKTSTKKFQISNLNETIVDRTPSLIQAKYIETLLMYCSKKVGCEFNAKEMTEWIISDLVNMKEKKGNEFDFKYAMNAISEQIRRGKYRCPYVHKHINIESTKVVFKDGMYEAIKKLEMENDYEGIKNLYSNEEIKVHQFGYILEIK